MTFSVMLMKVRCFHSIFRILITLAVGGAHITLPHFHVIPLIFNGAERLPPHNCPPDVLATSVAFAAMSGRGFHGIIRNANQAGPVPWLCS